MPLSVKSFPRPPRLEKVTRHLVVKWASGEVIADTRDAYWVLETHHPPTYYIPPSDIKVSMSKVSHTSRCEYKGKATYFAVPRPQAGQEPVQIRAWCYERPTPAFKPITDYMSFYVGPWDCYVDDEKVEAQPGDFYGGWWTSEIEDPKEIKGAPGTLWK